MSSRSFSPEQLDAIRATGANLLVSAAAGAGKTTVLVERVIHLLLSANPPVDLDRFLVVTFTRGAAAEMKDRIAERLRSALDANPDNAFLRKQLHILDQASIGTIDSFCQEIVRHHFHCLGVNPAFAVLDPDEASLLWSEVRDAIFESHYADESPRGDEFRALVDAFGGRGHDADLSNQVRNLYDFIVTSPASSDPLGLAMSMFEDFTDRPGRAPLPIGETAWGRYFQASLSLRMNAWLDRLERAAELARNVAGDDKLIAFLHELQNKLESAYSRLGDGDWSAWRASMPEPEALQVPRMPSKLPQDSKDMRRLIRANWIDPAIEDISAVLDFEARYTEDEWRRGIRETRPLTQRLILLAQEIIDSYSGEKRRLNSLDFSDLEQLALRALSDPEIPASLGQAARLCRERYEYVLVDEFQDINDLQAELLRRVSRQNDEFARPANLFAVGDVKQSIYGFRLADPDIFIEHYNNSEPYSNQRIHGAEALSAWSKIDLPRNYRCRQGIIDAVNCVFRFLMDENLGGIPYNERAELQCGREIPEFPRSCIAGDGFLGNAPDVLLVDAAAPIVFGDPPENMENPLKAQGAMNADVSGSSSTGAQEYADHDSDFGSDSESQVESLELEGFAIARHLIRLVGRNADGSDSGLWIHAPDPAKPDGPSVHRPVQWRDIVILLRTVRNRVPVLLSALRRCGVPVSAAASRGLGQTIEGRDIISALMTIDNPCQDIPLSSFLRSPLCGFSDDDLLRIRRIEPREDYYTALSAFSKSEENSELAERCSMAIRRIEKWREIAGQCSIAELIDEMMEETSYRVVALKHRDGAQRAANIDALRDRAAQFDSFSRRGLAKFIDFIERLSAAGNDPESGAALAPGDNSVRILSIHKAKGLEYPVVVLADMAHRFNLMDLNGPVVMDRKLMIGMRRPTRYSNVTLPAIGHEAIRSRRRLAILAEEMRVLYVGMTRARDHLIMTGVVKKPAEWLNALRQKCLDSHRSPLHERIQAKSPMDWLGPLLAREYALACATPAPAETKSGRDKITNLNIHLVDKISVNASRAREFSLHDQFNDLRQSGNPCDSQSTMEASEERAAMAALDRALSVAPLSAGREIKAKLSVTEIKRMWDYSSEPEDGQAGAGAIAINPAWENAPQEAEHIYHLPKRAGGQDGARITAAGRGTLIHQFLYYIDYARASNENEILLQIDELIHAGRLPAFAKEHVDIQAIRWLFETNLGESMRTHSERVKREYPFVSSILSEEIPHSAADYGAAPIQGEPILVQGVMDGVIVLPNSIILFDYKTDNVFGEQIQARAQIYQIQLRLYARALEEIYARPIGEAWLAFLSPRILYPVRGL